MPPSTVQHGVERTCEWYAHPCAEGDNGSIIIAKRAKPELTECRGLPAELDKKKVPSRGAPRSARRSGRIDPSNWVHERDHRPWSADFVPVVRQASTKTSLRVKTPQAEEQMYRTRISFSPG